MRNDEQGHHWLSHTASHKVTNRETRTRNEPQTTTTARPKDREARQPRESTPNRQPPPRLHCSSGRYLRSAMAVCPTAILGRTSEI
ncbi:hypothetical protein GALMADRAFT_148959 [Galerina marginata CBS 339.88]|uniref:Uncharacterized protein n=1 Tax=Galerina marginata (strain CBS 339.88) TaxID=685588 RepID=A0A067S5H3_GALM3|nr:hypothetical protein GALMADRAFT_148959 [Galerina marginata CBS 339.88]